MRETVRSAVAQEQCPSCLQLYLYEMEHRCVECDAPVCTFCVVQVQAQWFCFSCKELSDGRESDVES